MTLAQVNLWGRQIGAVEWIAERGVGVFQYAPDFAAAGLQLSPIAMPVRTQPYSFPELARESFEGLPGLLADSLPDRYGHRLIDAWLAQQGRTPGSMNPVERLCYIGQRGMGALEFLPATGPRKEKDRTVDVGKLVLLANQVLMERSALSGTLDSDGDGLQDILRVGTSAGGARAKALLAWNPQTGEFRSGQIDGLSGFEHWLLKFDGVENNKDKELADPMGFGRIEYAYWLMAREAGIEMMPCHLYHEGGRSHFMTKRFDRTAKGRKLHMQTLAALCHYDYNDPVSYSYEQAIQAIRLVCSSSHRDAEQQFIRAVFSVVARNQDDHVKNIAFLMDATGGWTLSPAYDVTYAWNPDGAFTGQHQMSINGKRDNFIHEDLMALAKTAGMKPRPARNHINRVVDAIRQWPRFAEEAGVDEQWARQIKKAHRLYLASPAPQSSLSEP